MFCPKCGTNNADGSAFCESCGAPLPKTNAASAGNFNAGAAFDGAVEKAKGVNWKKVLPIAIGAVLVIVLVILAINIFGGNSAEDVAEKFVKATYKDMDAEAVVDLMYPGFIDAVVDNMSDYYDDISDKESFIAYFQENLDDTKDEFEDEYNVDFDDAAFSYEVKSSTDMTSDEIEDIEESYNNYYDLDVTVDEGAIVKIKVRYEEDGDKIDQNTLSLSVVKIDGKWYMAYMG